MLYALNLWNIAVAAMYVPHVIVFVWAAENALTFKITFWKPLKVKPPCVCIITGTEFKCKINKKFLFVIRYLFFRDFKNLNPSLSKYILRLITHSGIWLHWQITLGNTFKEITLMWLYITSAMFIWPCELWWFYPVINNNVDFVHIIVYIIII